ncbi:Cytosol aminopeptidase [Blattella germanica]|nr:Cytosol aminopeptidase [Blattella germanica]
MSMALARCLMHRSCEIAFIRICCRFYSNGGDAKRRGLVLGIYNEVSGDSHEFKLTKAGYFFNEAVQGKLEDLLKIHGGRIPKGEVQVFQNLENQFSAVAVAGLGPEDVGFNTLENLDECRENVRIAAGTGVRALRSLDIGEISVEGFGQAESAAEGAILAAWRFQQFRARENHKVVPSLELYQDPDFDGWSRAVEALCPCGVGVEMRDKEWIEGKKLMGLLTVSRSSPEPPIFLELEYCGGAEEQKSIVFIGKGVTFDSGGLYIRKCKPMREFRADMAGAAAIVGAFKVVASLNLPINVRAVIPLCENLTSGMAMRPGDIYFANNGMSIEIARTDNEGWLLLSDAIIYSRETYKPRLLVDVGTLTMGIRSALGGSSSGVYTTNHEIWREISKAGAITGDRVWRFPLWEHFKRKVTLFFTIQNIMFLNISHNVRTVEILQCAYHLYKIYPLLKVVLELEEFIPCGDWMHIDTTGCGMLSHAIDYPYLSVGRMTGRPTRTLAQFLYQISCPPEDKPKKR